MLDTRTYPTRCPLTVAFDAGGVGAVVGCEVFGGLFFCGFSVDAGGVVTDDDCRESAAARAAG